MAAGTDTTANSLSWFCALMSQYPEGNLESSKKILLEINVSSVPNAMRWVQKRH
jgi:cytochrome P450